MTRFIPIVAIALALAATAHAQDNKPARNVLLLPFVMQDGQAHQAWLGPALFDNLQKQAATAGHKLVQPPADALNPDGTLKPVADQAQARRLGQAAGADAVLFGTFGVTADQFHVNGALLDVPSGQVVGEIRGGGLLRDLLAVEAGLTDQMLAVLDGREPIQQAEAPPAQPAAPYDDQVPYREGTVVDPYGPAAPAYPVYPETVVVEQPVYVYPEPYTYWSVGFGYSSWSYCGPYYRDWYRYPRHDDYWYRRDARRDWYPNHRDWDDKDRGPRFREGEHPSNRVYTDRSDDSDRFRSSSSHRSLTVNGSGRVSESLREDSAPRFRESERPSSSGVRSTGSVSPSVRSDSSSRSRESAVERAPAPSRSEPSSSRFRSSSSERSAAPAPARSAPAEVRRETPARSAPPPTVRRESPAPTRSAPPAAVRESPSRSAPSADSSRSSRSSDRGGSFRSGGSSRSSR